MKTRLKDSLIVIFFYAIQCPAFTPPLNARKIHHYRSSTSSRKFIQNENLIAPFAHTPVRIDKFYLSYKNSNEDEEGKGLTFLRGVEEKGLTFIKEVNTAFETVTSKLPNLKVVFFSFLAGSVITVAGLFIPLIIIHDQFAIDEQIEQPVALFETILSDLDRSYVEEVNTNKLFETGVSAMLRSLDPYTEYFEQNQYIQETVSGRYGGVGLVISGDAIKETKNEDAQSGEDERRDVLIPPPKKVNKGIQVVSAFEGYAFDHGMRVGDHLLALDSMPLTSKSVDEVRNMLRGEPGTDVKITFQRDGVEGEQEVVIPRQIVKVRDVNCVALFDGVGYIQLTGFSQEAAMEVRHAILSLQGTTLERNGEELKGLILDLRDNPGGLLTSAVEVASLFLPNESDIVSAHGRTFPNVLYRSRVEPIVSPTTKLAVLTNSGTASAAEIVSGAIQDLDVGVIVGPGRTYGKGLVQNVEMLPFDKAMKVTVAKYYTPSGRCIQRMNYKEGGGLRKDEAGFTSEKIKDRATFYTQNGREVKDGGGIEPDYKLELPKASALEVTLLRSGTFQDFASEWCKNNKFTHGFDVSEELYKEFVDFCLKKQQSNELQLEALYIPSINQLDKVLKTSGYERAENDLKALRASILKDIQSDFIKYKKDIKEDISQNILARYLPESVLIAIDAKKDLQVKAAMELIADEGHFDKLLARDTEAAKKVVGEEFAMTTGSLNTANRDDSAMNFFKR